MEAGNLITAKPTGHHAPRNQAGWARTLNLAFQAIGVIYGDIGTSPLYVFASTFPDGIKHKDDILGVLSLIIYTLISIPMIKYVFIVLRANDNGDGGTFALYSLICRYADVGLIPKNQPEDRDLSNYKLELPVKSSRCREKVREKMEKSKAIKVALFLATILATAMVIGDGILTPCISVLSAVSGIKSLSGTAIVWISIAILVVLFGVQRFGTDKVGYAFAPVLCVWFLFITGIGFYNLVKYDPAIFRAFNPKYIIDYFKRTGKRGWISLGGVILCITGAEAMFADLGHFNMQAVQVSYSGVVFPSILITYLGQGAYLSHFPDQVSNTFYASIPSAIYWPTFVIAVLAAIIASQAMISGTFSIISQSLGLSCFPRVKVVHTSHKYEGQVYIPEINYIFMAATVIVTFAFKTTEKIGNAYGIAVVSVMLITTSMVSLIMLVIWQTKIWWITLFFVVFMFIEFIFFSSVLYKFAQGGYLPLAVSLILMLIMAIWHYAQRERYIYEMNNKVSPDYLRDLAKKKDLTRIPGIGLIYSELAQGVPPIFPHFLDNIPLIYTVTVFVCIKSLPISKVTIEERFLFKQVEPREFRMFCCVVRYGYKDTIADSAEFECLLVENLKEFIRQGQVMNIHAEEGRTAEEEMELVEKAKDDSVVYLIGEAKVRANKDSGIIKRAVINRCYPFLRNNFREGKKLLAIPRSRLLRVGMTYEV